jgi:DNA polymerase-3 subunit alpha
VAVDAKTKPLDFVHLHNHTHYSLLDGLQKLPSMLDRAKELGHSAMAITDHGVMFGAIDFYKEAIKRNIKPIIGMEAYIAPRTINDRSSELDRKPYHLILLAKNLAGYHNLMKLTTTAHLEGMYYKPRIDHDLLEQHREGLIVLSGCAGGELAKAITQGDNKKAVEIATWYQKTFGEDNYFLELQDHPGWEEGAKINRAKIALAKELGIRYIVSKDCHYTFASDHINHDLLLCVQTGNKISDQNRFRIEQAVYVASQEEIFNNNFADKADMELAFSNTIEVAKMCNLELKLGTGLIPVFDTPKGIGEDDYLKDIVLKGAARKYAHKSDQEIASMNEKDIIASLSKEVIERIEFELSIISKMGFSGYFLIVSDLYRYAKENGILCGPGRGSAAGSIIAYCSNITIIDPLRWGLFFERFLNPDRISMPDIDMDFADDRRDEIINYATDKYGADKVAHIITFGTMAARNAIRDVGRVLDIPLAEVDKIAKSVPPPVQGKHTPLKKHLEKVEELKVFYKNPIYKQLLDGAISLEGTIRNDGVHASAVVIAPEPIINFTPLKKASSGVICTQYSMNPIEDVGLLKFDFLGLSNLTIIKNCLRIIKKVYGEDINVENIPIDDKKTFELLAAAKTTGVFQLESNGMKKYIKKLSPTSFEDIVAMVAIYRPGPMQWIDDFINRKHHPDQIQYGHPKMKAVLESTYGIIVYQEQVMQISKDLCGFTGAQSDTLRKAMGKKQADTLAKMKESFIEGAIEHSGVERDFVEQLWTSLEDFSAYCFNKSHAACYGLIAIWTAYLKAHYPAPFMAALMTSDYSDIERIAVDIDEASKMGINVLPPDINHSFAEFAISSREEGYGYDIRFGLMAIKNVSTNQVKVIINERDTNGHFRDFNDFVTRIAKSSDSPNKKTLESLIKVGAFDSLFKDLDPINIRPMLLANMDKITSSISSFGKSMNNKQTDLFGGELVKNLELNIVFDTAFENIDPSELLAYEKELLGLYISDHPLKKWQSYLKAKTYDFGNHIVEDHNKSIETGGVIRSIKDIQTKNGQKMAFVSLASVYGDIEVVIFPKLYEQYADVLVIDKLLYVYGKLQMYDQNNNVLDRSKVLADKMEELLNHDSDDLTINKEMKPVKTEVISINKDVDIYEKDHKLYIIIRHHSAQTLSDLGQGLVMASGEMEVVLEIVSGGIKKQFKLPNKVKNLVALEEALKKVL